MKGKIALRMREGGSNEGEGCPGKMLSFFYIYKVAPSLWLFFALGSLAEFLAFFHLHNRIVRQINDTSHKLDELRASSFIQKITPFTQESKNVYAAYCNLTIFFFMWLMGEWLLGTFRYPTLPVSWTPWDLLGVGNAVMPNGLDLTQADEVTRRYATAFIIPFMILSLIFFCETFLTFINYPFGVVRMVGPMVQKFDADMETRAKNKSLWAMAYLIYRIAFLFPILTLLTDMLNPQGRRLSIWNRMWMTPLWVMTRLPIFLLRWVYLHYLIPVTIVLGVAVWLGARRILTERGLRFFTDLGMTIDRDTGGLRDIDRVRITIYSITVIVAQVFLFVHLAYVLTGNFNAGSCFYYTIFPLPSASHLYEAAMTVLGALVIIILSLFYAFIKDSKTVSTSWFWWASIVYVLLFIVTVLWPELLFLIFGMTRDTQIRGAMTLPVLGVLLIGARVMLEAFHNQMLRLFEYYTVSRREGLSYDILHRMKNLLHAASSKVYQVSDMGPSKLSEASANGNLEDAVQQQRETLIEAKSLLNDMLKMIERLGASGRETENLKTARPIDILNTVITQMKSINKMNVRLIISASGLYDITAVVNIDKLTAIFTNIIQNSLDQYKDMRGGHEVAERDPLINIMVSEENRSLVFKFEDEAGGAPDDVIEKLGAPFVSTKKDGLGLALFDARQSVAMMGGEVIFSNVLKYDRTTSGFCVTITLPTIKIN